MSHEDIEWKVYEHTNKGTQLACIDTTEEYQLTKYSIPVRIHTGAELKIDKELLEGPAESLEQLLVDQPAWISNLIEFIKFALDQGNYC